MEDDEDPHGSGDAEADADEEDVLLSPARRSGVSATRRGEAGSREATTIAGRLLHRITRVKPLGDILSQEQKTGNGQGGAADECALRKELRMTDVIAYGLGSTLGAGIFVVAGQAAVVRPIAPARGPPSHCHL